MTCWNVYGCRNYNSGSPKKKNDIGGKREGVTLSKNLHFATGASEEQGFTPHPSIDFYDVLPSSSFIPTHVSSVSSYPGHSLRSTSHQTMKYIYCMTMLSAIRIMDCTKVHHWRSLILVLANLIHPKYDYIETRM